MRHALLLGAVLGAIALAGCSSTSTDARSTVEVPTQWRTAAEQDRTLGDMPWGELFRTPELEVLVREALANNPDLRIAAERVELARAQYGFERSALFPTVLGDAAYTRGRQPSVGPDSARRT